MAKFENLCMAKFFQFQKPAENKKTCMAKFTKTFLKKFTKIFFATKISINFCWHFL